MTEWDRITRWLDNLYDVDVWPEEDLEGPATDVSFEHPEDESYLVIVEFPRDGGIKYHTHMESPPVDEKTVGAAATIVALQVAVEE